MERAGAVPAQSDLFRHGFVPALLLGAAVAWSARAPLESFLLAHALRVDVVTLVLLAAMVVLFVAERVRPREPSWNYNVGRTGALGVARFLRDFIYLLFVTQLSALLIRAAALRLEPALRGRAHFWPHAAPFALRALLAFLAVELCSYWLHRASHHTRLLWQFHSTHHVVEELSSLKALRTHPVDNLLYYLVRNAPLLLLGAGADEVLTVTCFGTLLSLLAHANLDVAEGVLGWFINFPRYHAVHHSADVSQSRANYGCHTIVWDRLFGTFREEPAPTLGTRPLGHRTLWQELIAPFYRAM